MEKLSRWITQKQASEILGKTLKAVYKLTRKGRFRSKIAYDKRVVSYSDVINYTPGKPGRPKTIKNRHENHSIPHTISTG
jgi:hypothetical protein